MLRAVAHSCIIVMAKLSLWIIYRLIHLYCWFAGGHNTIGTAIIKINIVQQHVVRSRSRTVSPKGAGFCCQAMIFSPNANPFFFFFLVPSVFFLLFLPWSATAVGCWYIFYTSVRAAFFLLLLFLVCEWGGTLSLGLRLKWRHLSAMAGVCPSGSFFTLTAVGVVRSTWWGPVHLGFLQCFLFRSFISTQSPGFRLCNWPSAGCGSAAFTCVYKAQHFG